VTSTAGQEEAKAKALSTKEKSVEAFDNMKDAKIETHIQ
jgi:hypothetical protein